MTQAATVIDLINAGCIHKFEGSERGRLKDKRRLKERGAYSNNCNLVT